MTNKHFTSNAAIPRPVKNLTWILICAGYFFFYMYTFSQGISFPNANLITHSAKIVFASTGIRILGSVPALLIFVIANNPRWLFINLISRIFIELGDVVVDLELDGPTINPNNNLRTLTNKGSKKPVFI